MSGAAQQYSTAMCCESGSWTFHVKLVVAFKMLYLTCCVLPAGMSKSQGPILVVMHSDSLQFWQGELGFWADHGLNVISYAGKRPDWRPCHLDWRPCLQMH